MEYTMRKRMITIDDLLKAKTLLDKNKPKNEVILKGEQLNKLYRTSEYENNAYYKVINKSFKKLS